MAAKRNSITDGAASIIKLVRRKNRRASITEQFLLPAAKTKHKEKVAQARHHAFLMQRDNALAIHELADRVRMITELDATTLGHTLSPMDKHRFQVWSTEMQAILTEFLPSETHENDPILQLLEKLQFLQDGHVCLAEVAIDGRQLIEKWERGGVFDDNGESSSDEDDDEEGDEYNAPMIGLQVINWEMEKRRKIEASYAYQCIRERAASRVIKRNTLKWVRSRVAFCSRVEEIQVFGNTTAALMEELTMLSPLQRRAAVSSASNTSDIFDLMKGKSHMTGAFKINFTDLMHYSKHLALFTVDHALRRVEELQAKRRLYEYRCAIKLQAWWRKTHEVVKGRRMLKLLAEVKRKQEQEKNEQRLREKAAKAPPAIKTETNASSHKVPKTPVGKSSKATSSTSTRSVSKGDGDASETASKAKSPRAPGRDTKSSYMPTPPSTPKVTSKQQPSGAKRPSMQHASKGEDKEEKAARAARAREAREARLRKAFEDELLKQKREDEEAAGDTQDVETAWKRFLESAQDAQADEDDAEKDENADILDLDGSRASTANSGASSGERGSRGATPYTNGAVDTEEWRSWSDSDDDHGLDTVASGSSNRNGTPRSTASSRLSTPHAKISPSSLPESDARVAETKPIPPIRVVVTVKKGNRSPRRPPASKNQASPSDEVETPEEDGGGGSGPTTPGVTPLTAHAPSRRQLLLMEAVEARKRRPKAVPGVGQLSRMMPFADFGDIEPLPQSRSQLRTPQPQTSPTTRRHLFEMDFQQAAVDTDTGVLDMFFLDQPLVPLTAEEVTREPPRSIETSATSVSNASPTRVVRAARVAKMRAALQQERPQQPTPKPQDQQPAPKPHDQREDSETPRTAPVVFKKPANSTTARDRLVLRTASPSTSDRDSTQAGNPLLKFDFRKEDLMRKSSQTAPSDVEPGPETSESRMKSKFGSHAEWVESMGLGGAVAAASRSARSPRRPNGRPVKINTDSSAREAKLVESMAKVKQTAVQRARRKRTQAHALPLIGRRPVEIKPMGIEPATPPEAHEKEKLPQVEALTRNEGSRSRRNQQSPRSPRRKSGRSKSERTDRDGVSSVGPDNGADSVSSVEEDEDSSPDEDEGAATSSQGVEAALQEENEEGSEFDAAMSSAESEEASEDDAIEGVAPRRKSSRQPRGSLPSPRRSRGKIHEPKHTRKPRRWHRSPNNDSVDEDGNSDDEIDTRGPVRKGSSRFRPNVTSLLQRLVPKDKRWSFDAMLHSRDVEGDVAEVEGPLDLDIDEEGDLQERQEQDEGDSNSDGEDLVQCADAAKAKAFEQLYTQYLGLLNAGPPLIVRP